MGPLCPCHPLLQPHTLHGATWKHPPPTWRSCRVPLGNCPEPGPIHIAYVRTRFLSPSHFCPQAPEEHSALSQASQHWRHHESVTGALTVPGCSSISGSTLPDSRSFSLPPCSAAGNTGLYKETTLEQGCVLTPVVIRPWKL